ncbi:S41 family peptidase [Tenuibacillus multivorans]|uniref:Carboxyl-terminal processing protease n=1 Tax=Tenuibacillus multivorans TaxID=237069 RepID=A0A1H0G6A2_9BACI|nr:S41 family peptidase [Tenuibacillus multivorans]GEL78817.1 hypothetical protein TMU01_30520 [Tenuibacillus multivorans]SDO02279.1 carboxyl-terminal processing protease [Tenuibacillus multivorans]
MKHVFRMMTAFIVLVLTFTATIMSVEAVTTEDVEPYIEEYYFEDVNDAIFENSVDDVFEELDPYSTYYTAEEYEQFMSNIDQSFVGIGISFELVEEGVFVRNVFEDSPAEEAGIKPGDIITYVDDVALEEKSSEEIASLIGGPEDTSVKITLDRNGLIITLDVTRQEIQVPIVTSQKLAGNIGYIQFQSFPQNLTELIQEHKQQLGDVDSWILDVRFNGGGYLQAAQQLLGMFPGIENSMIANYKNHQEVYKTIEQEETFNKPINLLINPYSASASEIFAAALKDYDKATLYGETTFGKGRMQSLIQLPEEDGILKLTVATFLSPLGNAIDEVGVNPDIETKTPLADAHWNELNEKFDYQVLNHLKDIAPDHQFTITLNREADLESFEEKVKLATLGGEQIDFDVKYLGEKQYQVTPTSPLQPGGEYAMYIQPGWTDQDRQRATSGVIVRISVKSK